MRTVFTTFPIFDSLSKQDYTRTGQLRPLLSPRQHLPPFQFEVSAGVATITDVQMVDCNAATTNITAYFANLPVVATGATYSYIQYKGDTLNTLLPFGSYYLKMTDNDANIYYSDYFNVENIYIGSVQSDEYIKLKFSNTKDLPTPLNEPAILYQDSFYDECWFKTELGTTEHETTRIGTEKNGVFIAEKMISVYRYKLTDYIGRNLYRALHRLPLHDDVEITDNVGNVYDVGHDIEVGSISWDYWDMGTLTLKFNDGASVWEGNANNLT